MKVLISVLMVFMFCVSLSANFETYQRLEIDYPWCDEVRDRVHPYMMQRFNQIRMHRIIEEYNVDANDVGLYFYNYGTDENNIC